jgi:hypothetical protein
MLDASDKRAHGPAQLEPWEARNRGENVKDERRDSIPIPQTNNIHPRYLFYRYKKHYAIARWYIDDVDTKDHFSSLV